MPVRRPSLLAALMLALVAPIGVPAHALDVPTNAPPLVPGGMRGMWLWQSDALLDSPAMQKELAGVAGVMGVTDLFLYINPNYWASRPAEIASFVTLMNKSHFKVWAADGCRCYLDDSEGPKNYYAGIDALIAYNRTALPWARFVGFHSDIEPQDIKSSPASFHNDIAGSKLNATGGGVWKASQAADRNALLIDWLTIQHKASEQLHAQGLRFGAAMPWWTEAYIGEQVTVDIGGGTRAPFSQIAMGMLDDYVVMSYATDPLTAAEHASAQAALASALAPATKVRLSAAMETEKGVGEGVSYGDTPGKQSKAMVMVDMTILQRALQRYPAFAGVSIEDWNGFRTLPR